MKRYFYPFLLLIPITLWSASMTAQAEKAVQPSPLVEVKGTLADAKVAIQYSSPSVKGRIIWDGLVPYGKVWRTGANEATTFETDKEIIINGEKLPAGKYALFTIPGEKEWTWVFNEVWDQWGAFRYDEGKDVLRIKAAPQSSPIFYERLTFVIENNVLSLFWENLSISLN